MTSGDVKAHDSSTSFHHHLQKQPSLDPFALEIAAIYTILSRSLATGKIRTLATILPGKMPRPTNRTEVLARLRDTIASGKAILGAGAGKFFSPCPLGV